MIRISLRVSGDTRRFDVTVRASDIAEAVNLTKARYPGEDVRVEFPIHPEHFFVQDTFAPFVATEIGRKPRAGGSGVGLTR